MNSEDKATCWRNLNIQMAQEVINLVKGQIGTKFYNSEGKKLEEKKCDKYIDYLVDYTLTRWDKLEKQFL
jgi:hypothetical protein